MPLFRGSVVGLQSAVLEGTLSVRLAGEFAIRQGRRTSPSEIRAWEKSLPVLARDLLDAGLDQVEVAVEYQLPLTSKRVDVVLAGVHPRTGSSSYVFVELKQWTQAEPVEDSDDLVHIDAFGRRPVLHPGAQVGSYCEYALNFVRALFLLR